MPKMPVPAMTVSEVARCLNVVERTIYRLAQKGELPGFKVAGVWRFQRDDILRWIEDRKKNHKLLTVRKVQPRKRGA
jgi:excisionase family DNA binding protein